MLRLCIVDHIYYLKVKYTRGLLTQHTLHAYSTQSKSQITLKQIPHWFEKAQIQKMPRAVSLDAPLGVPTPLCGADHGARFARLSLCSVRMVKVRVALRKQASRTSRENVENRSQMRSGALATRRVHSKHILRYLTGSRRLKIGRESSERTLQNTENSPKFFFIRLLGPPAPEIATRWPCPL